MMRNDHQDALAAGLGVSEFDPSGKSAQEIKSLWRWTAGKLAGDHVMHEAGELKEASEHAEVEFPILLTPPAEEPKLPVTRVYPTWADNGINWKAGL